MKTLRILMLALLLPAFVMTGCTTGGDNPGDAQIVLPNNDEKNQQAFADDETTGGFTFTAKQAWTATVTESGGSTRADGAKWLRLLFDGRETYSGAAGKFTLVIELDENYSGETRTATITIKSGNDTITITVTQDGKTETGVVPTPPNPVPDGMRYVSRIIFHDGTIDIDGDYNHYEQIMNIDYDSKNRIVRTTTTGDEDIVTNISYDDAARTVTMDDGDNKSIFKLNENGAAVSGEVVPYGTGTFTYADGYLSKCLFNSGEETFTVTWSGGNKTRMVVHDADGFDTTDLSYNTSWADNPLCNLNLNAFFSSFYYGIFSGSEFLGLLGKRSKNMVSSYKETYGSNGEYSTYDVIVEYDTAGFVTKITATSQFDHGSADRDVYMITYR